MVHPRGLSFRMQRKVVLLRDVKGLSFPKIAEQVANLDGEQPTAQCVADYYYRFSSRLGRVKSKYANCGRTAWKFSPEVKKWLVKKLLELRKVCVCTSTTLQHALARERGDKVCRSGIRKVLLKSGYKWLPRSQKRKYSTDFYCPFNMCRVHVAR